MAKYNYALRFDSKAQMELFQRAAKARRWSLNTFMIAAAEELAVEILGGEITGAKATDGVLQATD